MAGKFELKTAKDGEFFFTLKDGNGERLLSSETYKARDSALNGIESVKKNAADDKRYESKTSAAGKAFFVLKSSNGQIIGQSAYFDSEQLRDAAIGSVKKAAPTASTEDQTAHPAA